MSTQSDYLTKERPLVLVEEQIASFCHQDKYAEMADAFSSFVKTHPGIGYLAFEPIPSQIGDHLVEKTKAPSAFMTFTIRRPTWRDELQRALSEPASFQAFVTSLEGEILEIAKQSTKLS
jgi:hypothetical protein